MGGARELNAALLRQALDPHAAVEDARRVAAIRSAVELNAAAALVAYGAAMGDSRDATLAERIAGQLPRARAVVESGAAWALLQRWAAFSSSLSG